MKSKNRPPGQRLAPDQPKQETAPSKAVVVTPSHESLKNKVTIALGVLGMIKYLVDILHTFGCW